MPQFLIPVKQLGVVCKVWLIGNAPPAPIVLAVKSSPLKSTLSAPPIGRSDGRNRRTMVKNPVLMRPLYASAAAVSEANRVLPASCCEDRLLEGCKLRQFPKILGCGGQQELVFSSARSAEAQSIEPEDALQMSKEHLDLLPLPA